MTYPKIDDIEFDENPERLKIVWPLPRNPLLFALFSIAMVIWVAMLIGVFIYLIRDVIPQRERFTFVLSTMLIIWLLIWFFFGRVLWNRWQYFAANREILFINKEQLIVRRPVSILGITHAYDMNHVSPFYYSDKHNTPAFDYAYQHVYFGQNLDQDSARKMITYLNGRFFPDLDAD